MRLVEKKCPNCGGELKFGFEDKETKCEFCGRSFEIERDEKIADNKDEMYNAENYALTEEQRKAATAVVGTFAAMQIIPVIFIIVVAIIAFAGVFMFGRSNFKKHSETIITQNNENNTEETKEEEVEKTKKELLQEEGYIFNFDELTEANLNDFHENSQSILKDEINRYNAFLYNHGNWSYVGMYLLTSDYGNYLYDVYGINFKINGKQVTYYSGVKYDNVRVQDGKLKVNMKGYVVGRLNSNSTPSEKDTFGYSSTKDFYNKVIRGETAKGDVSIIGNVYNE